MGKNHHHVSTSASHIIAHREKIKSLKGTVGEERPVVLCVASRQEVARLKDIVREADENAFMFVTEAHEALGEGFSKLAGGE